MTAPESRTAAVAASDSLTCTVCPHRRADHDAIASRYCSATATSGVASAKGCVCRPAH